MRPHNEDPLSFLGSGDHGLKLAVVFRDEICHVPLIGVFLLVGRGLEHVNGVLGRENGG